MKDQILQRLKRFWSGFLAFTPGQKAVTIAAVLAILVGGWLFASWAAKPNYAPLFTNLAPSDASAIIDKLNSSKTPYKLASNGTEIMVPSKDVYSSRLAMSSAGLPTSGSSGYSLLDKEGVTTSDFKQHVDYQRALEGELSNTIKSINGVSDATVHLAIPDQTSVFNDGSQKTTAAVLLTLLPGTTLTDSQVQSVVNLVSSAVPGLSADQVSVSDSTGRVLSTAGDGISASSSDNRDAQTLAMQDQITQSVQSMLDKLVGPGHSSVVPSVDLNYDKTTSVSDTYSSASNVPPINQSTSREIFGPSANSSAGAPLGAGTPAASATPSAIPSGAYQSESNVQNNAVDHTQSTTTNAVGNIRRITLAVVLDAKVASQLNEDQVKQLVSQAAGLNAARGDSVELSVAPFDTSATDAAAAAAAKSARQAADAKRTAQLISMIKTVGLVLAVAAVFVVTLIASKRRRKDDPSDDLDVFLSTLRDDPDSLPPAPEDIVPPPSRESQVNAERQRRLAEMAESDPAEVARLLRGWLNSKEN
jgi:flagellar M-ring protein FliF